MHSSVLYLHDSGSFISHSEEKTRHVLLLSVKHYVLREMKRNCYRVFSHDVTAAILMFQTNPVGVELFSYVNAFFCSNKLA